MNKRTLISLGRLGEIKACEYLQRKNYQIIATNFKTKFGEIDIICKKDNQLIFVEVKSRISDLKGKPYESITSKKLKHFQKAVYYFLSQNDLFDQKLRIDVISIEFNHDNSVKRFQHFENLEFIKNL